MKLFGKWSPRIEGVNDKGEMRGYYVLVGVLVAVVAIAAFSYFRDHNSDIHIHVPKVEIH